MNQRVTMKYKKKVRLLVTNQCSRNCGYCHNEGMPKNLIQHMDPDKLENFLPAIKKYTNKIVLSGGEPFEYIHLQRLVDLLISYGFDISIISANINQQGMQKIAYGIKNVHCSIHNINNLLVESQPVRWLNNTFPNVRITLNVPFDSVDNITCNWNSLYELAQEVSANIQFIRLFSLDSVSDTIWSERWQELVSFMEPHARFLEATERETRFITKDLVKIDLLDIPCKATGIDYSEGACLNNSDITIDPSMRLSVCRWTNSSVSLYEDDKAVSFDSAVMSATMKSCQNCRYGEIKNYLKPGELNYYLNAPHYTWPQIDNGLQAMYCKTFTRDISYFGKSGSVLKLENEFAKYIGVNYCLAVTSGTTAVYLACLSLNLSREDEVLIPVATYPTLVAALLSAGVKVKLCDVDPLTGNISVESMKEHISPKVKAVLVTHLWGLPVDMDAIQKLCRQYGIYIIEDCSHAYGASIRKQKVGAFGDIACFSLQANKAVYAGEGGLVLTSSRELYERVVTLSSSVDRILDCVKDVNYLKYWGTGLGLKLKINPLGAPLALASLENIENVNRNRSLRASILERAVAESEVFTIAENKINECQRTYYTFKLTLKDQYLADRDDILQMLIHYGLEANVSSFIPVHRHDICSRVEIVNADERFGGAEKYFARIISLPAFVYEPINLVKYYASIIRKVSKHVLHQANID